MKFFEKSKNLNFLEIALKNIDDEKDPRNLLIAFDIVLYILDTFNKYNNFNEFIPKIFEDFLEQYYPITYRKPINDPNAIKFEDLELKLNFCLCHKAIV